MMMTLIVFALNDRSIKVHQLALHLMANKDVCAKPSILLLSNLLPTLLDHFGIDLDEEEIVEHNSIFDV